MVASPLNMTSGRTCTDLSKMVQEYAWKSYTNSLGKAKRFLARRKDYVFDFQWNFLDLTHSTNITETKPEDELLNSTDFGTPRKPLGLRRSKRFGKLQAPDGFYKKVPMDFDDAVVMDTVYIKNTTDSSKCHTFSSLSVDSTVSVDFAHSYSLGGYTNVELTLPEPCSRKTFTATDCQRQDFQDVCVLDFNQQIVVEAGHRVEATYQATEKTQTCDFEVTTTMSLAIGCLPVVIKRRTDDKAVFTCFITSLHDVFDNHVGKNLLLTKTKKGDHMLVKSRGKCKFTTWVDPQIMAQSELIIQ